MKKYNNMNMYLVYQPKVSLKTREIIGVEALSRFINPKDNNLIETQKVIESICDVNEMIKLTKNVFEISLLNLKELEELNLTTNISINMSSKEICMPKLSCFIDEVFKCNEKYINKIEIEITEREKVEDINIMKERIVYLREKGFKISIDDLSSGFNNIEMIRLYDIDIVKVDKSVLKNINTRINEIHNIVLLAQKKKLKF